MGAVVTLIVGLAGGLALVVLFTLANTNVSERIREMATLKASTVKHILYSTSSSLERR